MSLSILQPKYMKTMCRPRCPVRSNKRGVCRYIFEMGVKHFPALTINQGPLSDFLKLHLKCLKRCSVLLPDQTQYHCLQVEIHRPCRRSCPMFQVILVPDHFQRIDSVSLIENSHFTAVSRHLHVVNFGDKFYVFDTFQTCCIAEPYRYRDAQAVIFIAS